jgi:hypothetical protein
MTIFLPNTQPRNNMLFISRFNILNKETTTKTQPDYKQPFYVYGPSEQGPAGKLPPITLLT